MTRSTESVVAELLADFRRRMTELGINFAELARRLGLSRARVSELFSARCNPTVGSLIRVAEVLGCQLRIELATNENTVAEAKPSALPLPGQKLGLPRLRVSVLDTSDRAANR